MRAGGRECVSVTNIHAKNMDAQAVQVNSCMKSRNWHLNIFITVMYFLFLWKISLSITAEFWLLRITTFSIFFGRNFTHISHLVLRLTISIFITIQIAYHHQSYYGNLLTALFVSCLYENKWMQHNRRKFTLAVNVAITLKESHFPIKL